jgi:hypothetical protein
MPAFHNLFPFFSGGSVALEEEEEKQCLFETMSFWPRITLFNFILEALEFSK